MLKNQATWVAWSHRDCTELMFSTMSCIFVIKSWRVLWVLLFFHRDPTQGPKLEMVVSLQDIKLVSFSAWSIVELFKCSPFSDDYTSNQLRYELGSNSECPRPKNFVQVQWGCIGIKTLFPHRVSLLHFLLDKTKISSPYMKSRTPSSTNREGWFLEADFECNWCQEIRESKSPLSSWNFEVIDSLLT